MEEPAPAEGSEEEAAVDLVMNDLESIINDAPLNEATGADDELEAMEAVLEHAEELVEQIALDAARQGDPGAIAAAVEAGAIPASLGEAMALNPQPPAPPAAAVHPAATLSSIAAAGRWKQVPYRISKKRTLSRLGTGADAAGPSGA